MAEENKENPPATEKKTVSDLLMKPFTLGWTREVVKRVVTHSGTPNCDIYYFNPDKKKLRSLTEVKNNLPEGLTIECFSFKREALGLGPEFETTRNAKVRGKGGGKFHRKKRKASQGPKEAEEPTPSTSAQVEEITEKGRRTKKQKLSDEGVLKPDPEAVATDEKTETAIEQKTEPEKKPKTNPRRAKSERSNSKENADFVTKLRGKLRGTGEKNIKPTQSVKVQAVKQRKAALKKVMSIKQAKQAKVVPSKQKVNNIVRKKVTTPRIKLTKAQRDKKAAVKGKKNAPAKKTQTKTAKKPAKRPAKSPAKKAVKKTVRKPAQTPAKTPGRGKVPPKKSLTKSDTSKLQDANETDKKTTARDLKSIVKKNIGKYREMREQQKLGVTKTQPRKTTKKVAVATVRRSRSEPIAKNKSFYMKPLDKGWRRELVYRSNSSKSGQQADVYYFHPNGKKLRSCREISENLTHGLSIEYFTFRKEPLGCGEPSEVIRNARSFQKR